MKITILKENLREGLAAVGRIAQKNLSLPILNSVLLEAEKSFLCLKTTDLELGIKWWVLAKIEKEGKIACPLRFFQGLVDSLSADKISLKTDDKKLILETENFQSQINGQDPEDFPIIPEPETKVTFLIKDLQLVNGLSRVVDMAAVSTVKPEISGVYFYSTGNQMKMVATDSFRLAEKTLPLEEKPSQDFSFILPQRACRELINIFSEKEKESTLKFYVSSNQILVESLMTETSHPRVHFLSRLIEGEYPNYQEIIPQEFKLKAVSSKNDFLQNLRTVSLFSNKINEVKIKIDPKEQKIEFSGQNSEIGQSSSVLPSKIEGEEMETSFNWKFLAEGLNQIKDKEFVFTLSKDEGPAVLKPKEDSSYFYLLMPLRL